MNTIEKDEVFGNKNQLTGETVEEISFEKNIIDWENEGIDIHDQNESKEENGVYLDEIMI